MAESDDLSMDGAAAGQRPAGDGLTGRAAPINSEGRGDYLPFLPGTAGAGYALVRASAFFWFFSAASCFFFRSFAFGDLSPMDHRLGSGDWSSTRPRCTLSPPERDADAGRTGLGKVYRATDTNRGRRRG